MRFRLLDHRWFHDTLFRRRIAANTAVEGSKRPTARAAARGRPKKRFMNTIYGPGAIPQVLIFWFSSFMNTTKGFQIFHVEIVVNTVKNFQTSQWNPCHKIKKICVVYNEMTYCWFFAKNEAVRVHSYGVMYLLF